MIITISGTPGSGKSTVAKILAKKLGLKHYSTGDFMREMAKKRGLTLEELGNLALTDLSIDQALDQRQIQLGQKEDNFVIDGRLSFHFIPHSCNIFIEVDLDEGARRILNDIHSGLRKEEQAKNIQDLVKKTIARKQSEIKRYQKYYHINPNNKNNYDLVLDSTKTTAEQVAEKIIKFIKRSSKD